MKLSDTDMKMGRRLTVKEFAEQTGLSRVTVYRYIKQGKLDAERVNGVLYVIQPETQNEKDVKEPETAPDITIVEHLQNQNDSLKQQVTDLKQKLLLAENTIETLRKRVAELEADKAYLQERIVALEKLLESLTPKALPKPPLRERIRRLFKRRG